MRKWRDNGEDCITKSSPYVIRVPKSRRMRWAGSVVRMGEMRDGHNVLVGKREGKSPLGRPEHR
jgi:hypothetical protein